MPTTTKTTRRTIGTRVRAIVPTYHMAPRKATIPPHARIIDLGGAYRSSGPGNARAATISQIPNTKNTSGMPVNGLRLPTPTRERSIMVPKTMRNTPPFRGAQGTRGMFDLVKRAGVPSLSFYCNHVEVELDCWLSDVI